MKKKKIARLEAIKKKKVIPKEKTTKILLKKKNSAVKNPTLKKKSLDSIFANEAKYKAIMDHSPHAMFIGIAKGGFMEANQAACEMFGYRKDEFKKLNHVRLFVHDEIFLKKLKERNKGLSINGEVGTGIRKNGHQFPCEIYSNTFKNIDGTMLSISTIADITERKKAEQLLTTTNQLARVGSWEHDLVHKKMYWASVTKEIHEVEEDYVPDMSSALKFAKSKADRDMINEAIVKAVEKGEIINIEFEIITAKGNERWIKLTCTCVHENKRPVRLIGAIQDITALKFSEHEIEKSRQRYKSLFDNSPDIIISTELQGSILEANHRAANLLEDPMDELIGKRLDYFATPESLKILEKNFKEVMILKPVNSTAAIITAKGNEKTLLTSLAPITNDRQIIGLSAIAKDVTLVENYQRQLEFQAKLLNTIQQSVIVVNHEGIITYWNDFASSLYGWTSDEVLGKPMIGIAVPEYGQAEAKTIMEKLSRGETWSGEFVMRTKNNELFIAYILNSPIMDEQGNYKGTIGISSDITNEANAHAFIQLQATLLDSVEEAVIATDLDDKFIYWNKHAEKMYGWTKEEVLGQNTVILDYEDPLTQAEIVKAKLALQQGNSWSGEFKVKNKNDQVFPLFALMSPVIDSKQKSIGILSISHDITKEKIEEAKKEIERLDKETLINTTQDFMWSIDQDLKLLAANHAMIDMIKSQSGKTFERGDLFSFNGHYPEDYAQFFTDVQNRGLAGESFTKEFKSPLTDRWHEITVRPIIKDGDIIGVACYDKNITQQKYLSDKLEQRARELQESNNELERFSYVASHDLQEPLRMVSGFLQLLEKEYKSELDATAQKYIYFAVDGAIRMKQLIADLLEYSRAGNKAGELADNDMNDVVDEVLNVLRVAIKEAQASILCNPLPVLPNTRRTQLVQLLQNLIGNALKYRGSNKPEICIDAIENEHDWVLAVKDNGIGFESTNAERIFDVFQRLHNADKYSGTGIGLSICKKIVERHGGKIWARSTPGTGSTFYFSIPKEFQD